MDALDLLVREPRTGPSSNRWPLKCRTCLRQKPPPVAIVAKSVLHVGQKARRLVARPCSRGCVKRSSGSRPMSSANMQKTIRSRNRATSCGRRPRSRIAWAMSAMRSARLVGDDFLRRAAGLEALAGRGRPARSYLEVARPAQVSSRVSRATSVGGVGEVGVDDDAVHVADDQQGRVLQRLAVLEELVVGRPEVLALPLVLPAEAVLLPDVRPALAAALLGRPLLEGEPLPRPVGVRWLLYAEQVTEIVEVRL